MFSQFLGHYLLENQKITAEQYLSCMKYISANHVKLGMLAEHEGLINRAQANELNYLQMDTDRQIGDLAVEKGYLTPSEIDYLLGCQENSYLIFIQALEENKIMTRDEIDAAIRDFQEEHEYSEGTMDALKNGNLARMLPAFADIEDERYQTLLSLSLRDIIRFINSYIRFEKGHFADSISAKYLVYQKFHGDFGGLVGFCSDDDGILALADGYAKEQFEAVDEDALDSVAEFINCINGLYAAELSYQDVILDMATPEFYFDGTLKDIGEFFVMPVFIEGKKSSLIIKIE